MWGISLQLFLSIFAFTLSGVFFYLWQSSKKRDAQTLQKLDNFSKDIIHDINTPITSILLNIKLLEKKDGFVDNKNLQRIKASAEHIQEIQNNLTVLLQENSLKVQKINLVYIIQDVVEIHKKIYPSIVIKIDDEAFYVEVNKDAITQVITNLVSNACKYNHENGVVKIYSNARKLFIEDFGIGIQNPKEIFKRSYKEQKEGHGIGLDIVKRLCDAMYVDVSVKSKNSMGSVFILEF